MLSSDKTSFLACAEVDDWNSTCWQWSFLQRYQSLVLPILGFFQTHSPISTSPWGTPQFVPLSSISSSLTLWSFIGSCPPFSSSATPFCQLTPFFFFFFQFLPNQYYRGLFTGFHQCFIGCREHACHFVNVFVQNMWGCGCMCMWAMFMYPCRYLHSRGTGAESTAAVCISGLGSWMWTLYGCDLGHMECV